ncbi:aminoglycoside phosphotransferase family protein [Deinococcus radiodurans]|uniref:aminoglycoside phosphotransferase family protein n=1 Tax=Deinococcus radiodurans TaxID=1299 RepID=UPI0002E6B09E|nr:aminoglycoside phosphotransferase family protein [Deinococcus radiodurans]UTA50035.1 3'-kinase [Deinococcus radiodurans]
MLPFTPWLTRWHLTPDGEPLRTHGSDLLPVLWHGQGEGQAAMLKLARSEEERRGAGLMQFWQGDGAARVLAVSEDGAALLLERVSGCRSLTALVHAGHDDEATRLLCAAAARLHRPRPGPLPPLLPLADWFRGLFAGEKQDTRLHFPAAVARQLLASPQEVGPLHGDLHHANVLDGGDPGQGGRGWLAIDPKGLHGERGYDHANLLCNPDPATALRPGRLERQLAVAAHAARLDPARLARWVMAYTGLSAAWWLEDGREAEAAQMLALGERARRLF